MAKGVTKTWLRFDDVECVRCHKWAGPEGDVVYVVEGEGCVCTDCYDAALSTDTTDKGEHDG